MRQEATHFVEVWNHNGVTMATRVLPISYLNNSLLFSSKTQVETIAIFKIKMK